MKFPEMRENWDSRFMGIYTRNRLEAFHKGYVGKVRKEYSVRIESMQDLKERKTLAVNKDKQIVTKTLANVAASGANNEKEEGRGKGSGKYRLDQK